MRITKNAFRIGGKACYDVVASTSNEVVGRIRFFCRRDLLSAGRTDLAPHWALEHASGRIDRRDTLEEIRDEAAKSYLGRV